MQKKTKKNSTRVEKVIINMHVDDLRLIPESIPMEDQMTWEIRREERKKEGKHRKCDPIKYNRTGYSASHTLDILLKEYGVVRAYYVPKEWHSGSRGYKISIILQKDVRTTLPEVRDATEKMLAKYVFGRALTYVDYDASYASINLTDLRRADRYEGFVRSDFALAPPRKMVHNAKKPAKKEKTMAGKKKTAMVLAFKRASR